MPIDAKPEEASSSAYRECGGHGVSVVFKPPIGGSGGGGGGGFWGDVLHVSKLTHYPCLTTPFRVFFSASTHLSTHTHTRPHKSNTITLPIIIMLFIIILLLFFILLLLFYCI